MSDYADDWRKYVETATDIRWGTEAHHKLGDISRDDGDFFHVDREEDDHYVGAWLTGFGFIGVQFPKAATREITADERDWLAARPVTFR